MLKTRIIPTLLWKNYTLVKGKKFDSWRRVSTIIPAIKVYNTRQVDELIIVDIMATLENREPDYVTVNDFSKECFMPLTVGGGVSKVDHVKKLLRAGADKVTINSSAFEDINIISESADKFGRQCIVASVDVKKINDDYICFKSSGTVQTEWKVQDWAKKLEENGAGELLLTSIDRDGTMEGYDTDLLKRVTSVVNIPVIAQGGCGNYEHMFEALDTGKAHAVSAASIFHFTEQTPLEAKKYLKNKDINVRL